MDEKLVEGNGGGWRLLDGTKYHHVEMEESRQRQQTQASIHPSIHPSIHTIGLLRSTIVMTSL